MNSLESKLLKLQKTQKSLTVNSAINKYDLKNNSFLKGNNSEENKGLFNEPKQNMNLTQIDNEKAYSKLFIGLINSIKKSNNMTVLPELPYGKRLSDLDFIELLKKNVLYANNNLESNKLEKLKKKINKCK